MEVASGLELRPDGRFRYALEYGAVSEEGGGKWRLDGPFVLLTSDPMPRAPDFTVVRDDPAPHGELTIGLSLAALASRLRQHRAAPGHIDQGERPTRPLRA